LKYCIFTFLLLGLIFIDAEHKLLPDRLTLPGLILGILFSLFVPVQPLLTLIMPVRWFDLPPAIMVSTVSLVEALLGAGISALLLFAVGEVYFRLRHVEGMGFGDVKLMAMVGAFLGTKLGLFVIFAGSLLGSVFGVAVIFFIWQKRAKRWRELRKLPPREARQRAWRSAGAAYQRFQIPFGVFLGSMAIAAVFVGEPVMQWYWGFFR